ncbi:MAG: cellulase family glycosylhydrolase, partial [Eubacteriales bacterium]|nr:cellulase family glycosylhydrolase [Eubacteriales bacterium]
MVKKKTKRIIAAMITLALVLTSVNLPEMSRKAKAAVTPPEENLKETSILTAKGDTLISTQTETSHTKTENGEVKYDGYIQTLTAAQYSEKYYKVTFQVAEGTAQDTDIFTFQPYDTSWNGWQQNIIKFSDAQYDEENSQYVAYMSGETVLNSYTDGGTLNGVNISFCQSEPTVTLTGLYTCKVVDPDATLSPEEQKWEEEQKVVVWADDTKTTYGHEQMQDLYLSEIIAALGDAGSKYAFDKVSSQKITVYLKVTKCSRYSRIKISGGNLSTGSFSNKELIGIDNTTNTKENGGSGFKNNAHYLHAGWGTTGGYGSGMGQKESAVYKFETTSVSKGDADTAGFRLRRMTTDVEGYICGIAFGTVGSVTVSEPDESGTVTVTEGFDDSNVESWEKDESDIEPKPESEMRADEVVEINKVIATAKTYKQEDILDSAVWTKLQEELTKAENLVADETSLSTDIKAQRTLLSGYLATVDEEIDRTATRNGLKSSIDYCKTLKEEDYSNKETFAKLAGAITTAEAAYANTADTRLNYKSARDTLEKVRVALAPNVSTAESNPKPFRILGKDDVTKEMGAGINLGNTMDGGIYDSSETGWQAYKTTKEYIKALHDAGYNTVRIPVTWGVHINEDYTIEEAWISRVQEIVDYCVDQDMYAVINIHHDGAANHDDRGNNTPACWLDTYAQDIETVYQKYEGVWKNIAERFKDYDEHLIFESMNEVTDAHGTATNEDDAVLNALNQLFINTVRATGSNNTKRWLAITGRFATTSGITEMPEDTLADEGEVGTTRLMFAVHIYKANSNVRWSYSDLKTWQSSLSSSYKAVLNLDPNMPLYVGEYGVRTKAQSGSATGYNNAERALNYELCAAVADFYNAIPMVWDQGTGNYMEVATEEGLFTDWNRPNLKPVYDDVVFGTIRGTLETGKSFDLGTRMSNIYTSYGHSSTSDNSVSVDPTITKATDIELSDTKIEMKAGERKTVTATPDSSRDIVLWSTADDSIATVYNGVIHAKAGGITTIYATSQSGSVTEEIQVIVTGTGEETATGIKTEKPYYEMTEGDTLDLVTSLTPADSKDTITYTSSNTDIVTVSSSGKVTAENAGLTYIIVKAASGVSTIVAIKVNKKATSGTVGVTLNTIFASNGLTEKSQPITITGDGQYTLTYDIANDLSEDGKKAGITKLEDLTAIFIRDTNTLKPVVSQAYVRYDKVVVNDTELTLKKLDSMDEDGFKNLLKDNGQLDSNDPINGWDGCAVEEVTINSSKHSVSFKDIENPTKISVTFTIKDMKFFPGKEKENEATKIESVTDNKIVIPAAGEATEIELNMTPSTTDSEVTFYSTDSSVAVVGNTKQTVDENGKIKVTVTAISEGTTTLVGITENGLKVLYTIGVGDMSVDDLADPEDPTPEGLDGSLWGVEPEPSATPAASATPGTSAT